MKILLSLFVVFFVSSAIAEENPNFVILEQTISTPFRPVSAYLITAEKNEKGQILIHQYYAMPYNNSEDLDKTTGKRTVSIGSLISPDNQKNPNNEFYYCFFMASINGEFAVTEVKMGNWENLKSLFLSNEELEIENKKYEQQIPLQRTRKIILDNKLVEAKQLATKIAGIDDLMDLKSELTTLKDDDKIEIQAINTINEIYTQNATSPNNDEENTKMRANLGDLLKKITIANFSKQQSNNSQGQIFTNYQRKIELVRVTQNIDVEALAREALELRRQRIALEATSNNGE